jgi:hypothetical protein
LPVSHIHNFHSHDTFFSQNGTILQGNHIYTSPLIDIHDHSINSPQAESHHRDKEQTISGLNWERAALAIRSLFPPRNQDQAPHPAQDQPGIFPYKHVWIYCKTSINLLLLYIVYWDDWDLIIEHSLVGILYIILKLRLYYPMMANRKGRNT